MFWRNGGGGIVFENSSRQREQIHVIIYNHNSPLARVVLWERWLGTCAPGSF